MVTSDSYQSNNFHPRNKILPFTDFAQAGLKNVQNYVSLHFGSREIAKGKVYPFLLKHPVS